ncbi:MAG: gliding motility lipoprotein GldH [Bacteroidales bacterium]|nr:gliding motility lipoprotein GldH [Bacteroidales bacterium]
MKRLHIFLVAALTLTALTACNRNVFYDRQHSVNEHGWLPTESVVFDVDVADTTTVYNFLMEVRNTVDYPYANTFLFLTTTFPDGSLSHDTLEFPLADVSGRWLGKRTGRFVDTRYYFRRNARFPMEGTYRFAVSNGMRDSAISGLKDIGLRIEYSNMN